MPPLVAAPVVRRPSDGLEGELEERMGGKLWVAGSDNWGGLERCVAAAPALEVLQTDAPAPVECVENGGAPLPITGGPDHRLPFQPEPLALEQANTDQPTHELAPPPGTACTVSAAQLAAVPGCQLTADIGSMLSSHLDELSRLQGYRQLAKAAREVAADAGVAPRPKAKRRKRQGDDDEVQPMGGEDNATLYTTQAPLIAAHDEVQTMGGEDNATLYPTQAPLIGAHVKEQPLGGEGNATLFPTQAPLIGAETAYDRLWVLSIAAYKIHPNPNGSTRKRASSKNPSLPLNQKRALICLSGLKLARTDLRLEAAGPAQLGTCSQPGDEENGGPPLAAPPLHAASITTEVSFNSLAFNHRDAKPPTRQLFSYSNRHLQGCQAITFSALAGLGVLGQHSRSSQQLEGRYHELSQRALKAAMENM
eukprot:gene29556-5905_t